MIKTLATPKLTEPIMICAWPGMGEVAIRAALYLREQMGFKEYAALETPDYFEPSAVFVKDGVLEVPSHTGGVFYYYKNQKARNDIILFISEAQPNPGNGLAYAEEILSFAKKQGVTFIYTFAAMTVPIEHTQRAGVWFTATSKKVLRDFKNLDLKLLKDGQISGLNGLMLGVAKNTHIDGVCLLGEIPLYTIQIENPKASLAILEVLNQVLGLDLDLERLRERQRFVEGEIDRLIGYIKGEVLPTTPLSEEDVDKIKKELAAFTRLPESARKRIEDLFRSAAKDLTSAGELKKELDVWNVFKDYEDRFLDLFRKKRSSQ